MAEEDWALSRPRELRAGRWAGYGTGSDYVVFSSGISRSCFCRFTQRILVPYLVADALTLTKRALVRRGRSVKSARLGARGKAGRGSKCWRRNWELGRGCCVLEVCSSVSLPLHSLSPLSSIEPTPPPSFPSLSFPPLSLALDHLLDEQCLPSPLPSFRLPRFAELRRPSALARPSLARHLLPSSRRARKRRPLPLPPIPSPPSS